MKTTDLNADADLNLAMIDLNKADADWNKAETDADRDKANIAWNKANVGLEKALSIWNKINGDWIRGRLAVPRLGTRPRVIGSRPT